MKIILSLDMSINIYSYKCNKRIEQYKKGLLSILKYIDFFIKNNIFIILVDNTIENLEDYPEIKNIIPYNIICIFKKLNNYGKINKGAGCIEHLLISKHIWINYEYLIHFEVRQTLNNNKVIEEFLLKPISTFSWAHKKPCAICGIFEKNDPRLNINLYGIDNTSKNTEYFNDFYTGLFTMKINYLKELINYDLDYMIKNSISYEKLIMSFTINNINEFKIVDKLYINRGGDINDYDSKQQN